MAALNVIPPISSSYSNDESVVTPRTKFERQRRAQSRLTLDLIMTLDSESIDIIRTKFMQKPKNAVTLTEFIEIIRGSIRREQLKCSDTELVTSIVDLFNAMDLDGDKILEFEEFLTTIIDTGTEGAENYVMNPIKEYKSSGKVRTSPRQIDKQLHYLQSVDQLLVIEPTSRLFRVYNPGKMQVLKEITNINGNALVSEYIPTGAFGNQQDVLAISTTKMLCLYDGVQNLKYSWRAGMSVNEPQTAIKWAPEQGLLYCGSIHGVMSSIRLDKLETKDILRPIEINCSNEKKRKIVSRSKYNPSVDETCETVMSTITAIEVIPRLDAVMSASLDSTIRMWDTVHGQEKKRPFCGHSKGVVCLAYSDEWRFLLSGGFDHQLCLWSPFADQLVFRFQGHAAPLVSTHFVENTPQIVSSDMEGWVKVWDVRNSQCVQTFHTASEICSIAPIGPHRRLIVGSPKELILFDQEGGQYGQPVDEEPITCVLYNNTFLSFAVAGLRDVWNALNGSMQRVYRDICHADITAMCFDHRQRKLIIGDLNGNIGVFNYGTGAYMKSLEKHDREITFLHYINEDKKVISCSFDGKLKIHDEKPIEEQRVLNTFNKPTGPRGGDIASIAVSKSLELLAIGDQYGEIHIWDLILCKSESICIEEESTHSPITSLEFLGKLPFLAAGDEMGNIVVWFVRPSTNKYRPAFSIANFNIHGNHSGITSLVFEPESQLIYSGDVDGYIKGWEIGSILSDINEIPIEDAVQLAHYRNYTDKLPQYSEKREGPIHPQCTWAAHYDIVKQIQIIQNPKSLMSLSYDKSINLWTLQGKLLSTISSHNEQRGTNSNVNYNTNTSKNSSPTNTSSIHSYTDWNFHVDVVGRDKEQTSQAQDIINVLDGNSDFDILKKYGIERRIQHKHKELIDNGDLISLPENIANSNNNIHHAKNKNHIDNPNLLKLFSSNKHKAPPKTAPNIEDENDAEAFSGGLLQLAKRRRQRHLPTVIAAHQQRRAKTAPPLKSLSPSSQKTATYILESFKNDPKFKSFCEQVEKKKQILSSKN